MAASTEIFRSALHGYNRTDVVQFIQKQTVEHEKALRLAREESSRLNQKMAGLRSETERLKAEKEALLAEKSELNEQVERLLAEQEALRAEFAAAQEAVAAQAPVLEEEPTAPLDAPIAAPAAVAAAPSNFNEMELAAYRRAELAERMARERAADSAERMKNIFKQADEKLTLTENDFAAMLETCQNDFAQMQALLSAARNILGESSDGLKAAAELCDI